jgi:hypothetical protein
MLAPVARTKIQDGAVPDGLYLRVSPEEREQLSAYMTTMAVPNVETAIHELLRQGLASTPADGLVIARAERAYSEVKKLLLGRTFAFVGELHADVEKMRATLVRGDQ